MPGIDLRPRGRLFAWATLLLIAEIAVTLFFVAGTHGWIVPLEKPVTTDFASFYAAGKLALAGTAELAYDQAAHFAAEQAVTAPGIGYQFFFYPPVFLLLAAPLTIFPYLIGFAVFEAATLLLWLAAMRPILAVSGRRWLVPALGFPAVFWTLGLGQNAFLSAALFATGTRLLDRRPWLAGMAFGALIYKPHLGLLIPVALLAGRHFRAIGGAALGAGGLVALSWLLFGSAAWVAYLDVFTGAHDTFENGRIELAGMITVFAAARLLAVPTAWAYGAQAVAAVLAAGAVAWVFWRRAPLPLRGAALLAGTLLALPVLLLYDLMLLGVAGAWLLAEARQRGLRRGEAPLLVAGYATPLFCRPLGLALHIGVSPVVCAAVLALALRRNGHADDATQR
jgi:Glycosyltransferase family 87